MTYAIRVAMLVLIFGQGNAPILLIGGVLLKPSLHGKSLGYDWMVTEGTYTTCTLPETNNKNPL